MSDAFEAIGSAHHRKLIEVLVAHPASTEEEVQKLSKLSALEVKVALKSLHNSKLVTARGTGKATKFSVSQPQLNKIAVWLDKVVEKPKSDLETKIEEQVENLADKLGEWIANGSGWIQTKLAENTNIKSVDELGREIGRKLAEAKKQTDDTVGENIREVVGEVKARVKRK
jgi:predicted transcriptional regulator